MKPIEDHMQLSQADRQRHLKLDEACTERGGNSIMFRGLLADFLDTTIPRGYGAQLCHACHNGGCSNPRHLYWGTAGENQKDFLQSGKKAKRTDGANMARPGNKNGLGNIGKPKSEEHRRKIAESIRRKHFEKTLQSYSGITPPS